jgi:hypothetical protein
MVEKKGKLSDVLGEIRYSGEFDYEELYQTIHNWYRTMQYEVVETYKHKMTGSGAEVELTFKGERKVTEFMKYHIETELKGWGMNEIEAVRNGKKQKLDKGRILVTIKFTLELDYNSRFDRSEFTIRMFNMIRFTLLRKKVIILWGGKLVAEAYNLHTAIKKSLKMETAYSAW